MATRVYDTETVARLSAAQSESSILGRLRRHLDERRERARIRAELHSMTSRELADLGLRESDIADVARGTFRRGE